jgi:hypothetical protein
MMDQVAGTPTVLSEFYVSMRSESFRKTLCRVHNCAFITQPFCACTGLMEPRNPSVITGLPYGNQTPALWDCMVSAFVSFTAECSRYLTFLSFRDYRSEHTDGTLLLVRNRRAAYGIQVLAHCLVRGGSQIDSRKHTV